MNIGANSITDTGLYFQWGDTQGYTTSQVGSGEGQKYFGGDDCIYYNYGPYNKYTEGDSKITLEASDDAVTAAWSGNWRMPTVSEFVALSEAVTSVWAADYQGSGVAGLVLTDKTDSSKTLFFPACSYAENGNVYNVDGLGNYWSSSLDYECGDDLAYSFYFHISNGVDWRLATHRYWGCTVRGVLDDSNS